VTGRLTPGGALIVATVVLGMAWSSFANTTWPSAWPGPYSRYIAVSTAFVDTRIGPKLPVPIERRAEIALQGIHAQYEPVPDYSSLLVWKDWETGQEWVASRVTLRSADGFELTVDIPDGGTCEAFQ
jgi:hypothetical protein